MPREWLEEWRRAVEDTMVRDLQDSVYRQTVWGAGASEWGRLPDSVWGESPYTWEIDRYLEQCATRMMVKYPLLPQFKLNLREGFMEKTATQKLDEIKSDVTRLESTVAVLARERDALREERNALREENSKMNPALCSRDDRALYVRLDGTTKNAPVKIERRPDKRFEYGPAYEVYMTAPSRCYRLAFSQGSLHVYQEV
jgi:outer membrane murein-binding lipoprotein Lpp